MAAAGTAAGPTGPEPMPSYAQLVQRGWGSALAAARGCADCGWGLARRGLAEHAHLAPPELLLLALCALGWTALRSAATSRLFRPLAKRCRLQPRDAAKMPESAWKFLFYLGAWSYSAYLLFGTDYPFFHDPPSVFYDWKTAMAVPRDIAAAYLLQGSFYGHSIYATLYMDAWRKDSVVMLIHHVVTLVLIVSSYAFRYHKVGILVLFLHDISDVQLEFTKLNIYFKSRGGSHHRLHALAADLGCLSFSLSWFWFRLYWFPLKVLYATSHCSLRAVPDIPFYFFFNALLLLLTLMNLYWFLYIMAFAAKVLTGQVREVKDVREYDTAEALSPKAGKAEPRRRRPAPGSRAARRSPRRPHIPARTSSHVASVPPPGPPGGQSGPAEDASGGQPATMPRGGAWGPWKHRAPRPGPRRSRPAPRALFGCWAVPRMDRRLRSIGRGTSRAPEPGAPGTALRGRGGDGGRLGTERGAGRREPRAGAAPPGGAHSGNAGARRAAGRRLGPQRLDAAQPPPDAGAASPGPRLLRAPIRGLAAAGDPRPAPVPPSDPAAARGRARSGRQLRGRVSRAAALRELPRGGLAPLGHRAARLPGQLLSGQVRAARRYVRTRRGARAQPRGAARAHARGSPRRRRPALLCARPPVAHLRALLRQQRQRGTAALRRHGGG